VFGGRNRKTKEEGKEYEEGNEKRKEISGGRINESRYAMQGTEHA
jgi:hypothetical protein